MLCVMSHDTPQLPIDSLPTSYNMIIGSCMDIVGPTMTSRIAAEGNLTYPGELTAARKYCEQVQIRTLILTSSSSLLPSNGQPLARAMIAPKHVEKQKRDSSAPLAITQIMTSRKTRITGITATAPSLPRINCDV
eukprot:6191571-Pleurochrysis_carterae.AAC.2